MKKINLFFFLVVACIVSSSSQTYLHPTVGVNGTNCGTCMVNTSSGTYYDNGGAVANYSSNVNQVYRVFCPSIAGRCVRATFTSFSMNDTYFLCFGPNNCCDYLNIRNGATQNSPIIYSNCTASPGTVTASSANGCLSFQFISDGSVQLGGWAATISNVVCAGGPPGTDQTDCPNSVQVCSDSPITWNSPGPGLISESCSGCSIQEGEDHSAWYVFQIQTGGTLGLTIDPANNADDYDFVLYGPGATCASLGAPIRCSYACSAGNTGLGNGAVDLSEQCTGNGWVSTLPVVAGQIYRLMVNHWDPPISGYTLDWNLTGGASLNCTPLSVDLTDFRCAAVDNSIGLYFVTATETNNDYFIIEKSTDGVEFNEFVRVQGKGNSNEQTEYLVSDFSPSFGTNYYRLTQVDFDGHSTTFDLTSCQYGDGLKIITEINILDLNGKLIHSEKTNTADLESIMTNVNVKAGMYILYTTYSDGSSQMRKFVKI